MVSEEVISVTITAPHKVTVWNQAEEFNLLFIDMAGMLFEPYDVTVTANGVIANNNAEKELVEQSCKEIQNATDVLNIVL